MIRTGKFVYVINEGPNNISAYSINAATGSLTPVSGSPFTAGKYTENVAVDPTGKFVYVTNWGDGNISAYTVNASTGALTRSAEALLPMFINL